MFVLWNIIQHSEHMSSPPVFSGVHVTRSSVLYVWFVDRCLSFVLFLLAIVLSVLLRSTDSDCPFGIFKLVFHKKRSWKVECSCSLETCWMLLEFELDMNLCGSLCSKFWRIVGEKWMYALAYRTCITDWYKFVKVKGAYHVCFMNQILTFSQETFLKSWMCLSTRSLLNSSWIWTLSELAYESLKQIVCSKLKLLPNSMWKKQLQHLNELATFLSIQ